MVVVYDVSSYVEGKIYDGVDYMDDFIDSRDVRLNNLGFYVVICYKYWNES